ncbi:hypothetical protein ACTA71_005130 [Dictyostelium dimigraforme]
MFSTRISDFSLACKNGGTITLKKLYTIINNKLLTGRTFIFIVIRQRQHQKRRQKWHRHQGRISTKSDISTKNRNRSFRKRVKMTRIRQRTAQRLKDSQYGSNFNYFQRIGYVRTHEHGVKFGFMGAFVKASTITLKKKINSNIKYMNK